MRGRQRRAILAFSASLALGSGVLSACGSSGAPQASGPSTQACQQVSAVLSDGPDPDVDPVGYAQAQILPLRQIHTADKNLQGAIDALDSAYQKFTATNGAPPAKQAVSRAGDKVNALCPGAAS
jgi:hypothetical protein